MHVLRGPEEIAAATIRYDKLFNDRRELTGPFDIIGDVHGCHAELVALLTELGYRVERDNAGPFEAWRDAQMTGPQTQEWLQGEALDALDGMNKGLMDAWKNAEGAGDALSRMGRAGIDALGQIKDALLKVAIQQMIIQPLTNALFGGGKSGGRRPG